MPRRKMRGGAVIRPRTIGEINPVARSNLMNRPAVPTPMSTWEKIKKFAKDNKIISRGLSAVSGMVGEKYKPIFTTGSALASSYGYGRKRKPKMMGGASNKVVRF